MTAPEGLPDVATWVEPTSREIGASYENYPCHYPSDADYEVKSWPAFFSAMIAGQKKHDMRDKTERTYAVGDKVLLREYDPFGGGYTGRSAIFLITYITSNETPCAMSSVALAKGSAILSVERVSEVWEVA